MKRRDELEFPEDNTLPGLLLAASIWSVEKIQQFSFRRRNAAGTVALRQTRIELGGVTIPVCRGQKEMLLADDLFELC